MFHGTQPFEKAFGGILQTEVQCEVVVDVNVL